MGNVESNQDESYLEAEEEEHSVEDDVSRENKLEIICSRCNTSPESCFLHNIQDDPVLTLRGIVMGYEGVGKSCLLRHLRGEDPFTIVGKPSYSTNKKQLMALTPWKIKAEEKIQLHMFEQHNADTDLRTSVQNISIRGLNPPSNTKTHPTSKEIDFLIFITDPLRLDTLSYTRTILDALFSRIQEHHESHQMEHLLLSMCIMVNFMDLIDQDFLFNQQDVRSMIQELYTSLEDKNKEIILSIPIFIVLSSMKDVSFIKSTLQDFIYIPYLQRREYHHRQLADKIKNECIIQCQHLSSSLESVNQHFRSPHHGNSHNDDLDNVKSQELIEASTDPSLDTNRKRRILPSNRKSTESSTHPQEKGDDIIPDTRNRDDASTTMEDIMAVIPTMDLEQFLTNDSSDDDDIDSKTNPVNSFRQTQHHPKRNHAVYMSDESDWSEDAYNNSGDEDDSLSPSHEYVVEESIQQSDRVSYNVEQYTLSSSIRTTVHDSNDDKVEDDSPNHNLPKQSLNIQVIESRKETEIAIAAAIQEATLSLEKATTGSMMKIGNAEEYSRTELEDGSIKAYKKNRKDKKKSKKTKKKES